MCLAEVEAATAAAMIQGKGGQEVVLCRVALKLRRLQVMVVARATEVARTAAVAVEAGDVTEEIAGRLLRWMGGPRLTSLALQTRVLVVV